MAVVPPFSILIQSYSLWIFKNYDGKIISILWKLVKTKVIYLKSLSHLIIMSIENKSIRAETKKSIIRTSNAFLKPISLPTLDFNIFNTLKEIQIIFLTKKVMKIEPK